MYSDFKRKFTDKNDTTKLSVAIIYAVLASVALNLFWQPGNIYASGVTGFAQIIVTVLENKFQISAPISVILLLINVPLIWLAWQKISHKFAVFTSLSVLLSSFFIQILPETVLTTDPIICAIFGGGISGFGIGFSLKNGISTGGLDIISLTVRKATGKNVGSINIIFNGCIVLIAGFLFGWPYAFYSALSIFVSGKVVDAVYTKQKKVQVMIITTRPQQVITEIQNRLRRGITILNQAEGAYTHEQQTVLITVLTRDQIPVLRTAIKESDRHAFVSIADNVTILGNFFDPGV
ncbi:YitT family protein [Vagococcus acidifermentans]|uniref:DUF2179 domain-containing protein n=1 Tax=Vagococcus acidifermentans TaxID=564710 RepID=A0A430AT02_9ENTE|nr:YitT family protein [Vagococcus acidifermentans]RSU11188.1 hypothetical protein CBF27_08805 [Vagococcus acidifermentans]